MTALYLSWRPSKHKLSWGLGCWEVWDGGRDKFGGNQSKSTKLGHIRISFLWWWIKNGTNLQSFRVHYKFKQMHTALTYDMFEYYNWIICCSREGGHHGSQVLVVIRFLRFFPPTYTRLAGQFASSHMLSMIMIVVTRTNSIFFCNPAIFFFLLILGDTLKSLPMFQICQNWLKLCWKKLGKIFDGRVFQKRVREVKFYNALKIKYSNQWG